MTAQTSVGSILPHEPLTLAGATVRASYHRSRLYDAFAWHRAHSGRCGGCAESAWRLARAEIWARDQRSAGLLQIVWEDDPDGWDRDSWCACDEPGCRYCYGDGPDSVEYCAVRVRRPESLDGSGDRCTRCERDADDCDCRGVWETVASLCGVMDADGDYRRTVEAELCLEAMGAV